MRVEVFLFLPVLFLASIALIGIVPRARLIIFSVVMVLQLAPKLVGPIGITLATAMLLLPSAVVGGLRYVPRSLRIAYTGLAVSQISALLWSVDTGAGFTRISQTALFGIGLLLAFECSGKSIDPLKTVLISTVPVVLVQAIMVVLFQFDAAAKVDYLRSEFSLTFLGRSGQLVFTTMYNNVADPQKSGGLLFVNANAAGMMLGVYLMATIMLGLKCSSRLRAAGWFGVSVVIAIAACATGSKSTIAILVVLVLFVCAYPVILRKYGATFAGIASALAMTMAIVVGSWWISSSSGGLAQETALTWDIRVKIWSVVWSFFCRSPLFGLGFGGWGDLFSPLAPTLGLSRAYPPHNVVVATWAESGVLSVLCIVAIWSWLVVRGVRLVWWASSRRLASAATCGVAMILWVVIHGFGDNTAYFGVVHTIPIICGLFAYYWRAAESPGCTKLERSVGGHVTDRSSAGAIRSA